MKAICITGNSQKHIEEVSFNLISAGLKNALPSKRDQDINLNVWHEQVLQQQQDYAKKVKIGKLWEQMAVDIFLANRKQDLWHWVAKDSLRIAEYWLNFDAGINFILVYTPYEDYFSTGINNEDLSIENIPQDFESWIASSQAIFDFHEKNPSRTIIVNSRNLNLAHEKLVTRINSCFGSSLTSLTKWNSETTRDAILNYLIRNYTNEHPAMPEIESKTEKYLPDLNQSEALDFVLTNYLELKANFATRPVSTETGILPPHNDRESPVESADFISELESENDLLLSQLHEIQEEHEKQLIDNQRIIETAKITSSRLKKILDHHPEYWESDQISVTAVKTSQTLKWLTSNSYLENTLFKNLQFQTSITENGIELYFDKADWHLGPFTKWPETSESGLTISYPPRNPDQKTYLSSLGPSDWARLGFLVARIIGYCRSNLLPKEVKSPTKNKLIKGMEGLQEHLNKWPLTLRFDSINLLDTAHIGEYQAIGISLNNISLGLLKTPSFSYRLATFNEPGKVFGTHPRLEFPEASRHALQSWFPESSDERGARLELRFSQPNQIDTNIWSKLSGNDQILIAALISNLKTQLLEIQTTDPRVISTWDDWRKVAEFMKITLSSAYSSKIQ